MKLRTLGLLLLSSVLLFSCHTSQDVASSGLIQKRKYMDGWDTRSISKDAGPLTAFSDSSFVEPAPQPKPSSDGGSGDFQINEVGEKVPREKKEDSCATITKRDGSEIKAMIKKIGPERIEYKKCERKSGPVYSVEKSEVFQIEYPDGGKDVFEKEETSSSDTESNSDQEEKSDAQKEKEEESGSDATGIIGFILSILALIIGIVALAASATTAAGLLLISVIVSLIALILGAISDSGLGTAALVISIINILVGGLLILLLAAAV